MAIASSSARALAEHKVSIFRNMNWVLLFIWCHLAVQISRLGYKFAYWYHAWVLGVTLSFSSTGYIGDVISCDLEIC